MNTFAMLLTILTQSANSAGDVMGYAVALCTLMLVVLFAVWILTPHDV